jgi:hypothetical protein
MDLAARRRAPGVLAIVTAAERRQAGQGQLQHRQAAGRPEIDHYHQAVALVVAETFEQARAAAQLVRVDYERAPGRFDLAKDEGRRQAQADAFGGAADKPSATSPALRRRAGAGGRHLHHARPVARDDGAARDHRRVGATSSRSGPRTRWSTGPRRPAPRRSASPRRRCAWCRPSSAAASAASCSCAPTRCWPRWARGPRGGR